MLVWTDPPPYLIIIIIIIKLVFRKLCSVVYIMIQKKLSIYIILTGRGPWRAGLAYGCSEYLAPWGV